MQKEQLTAYFVLLALTACGALMNAQSVRRQLALSLEQQVKSAEARAEWLELSKRQPGNPEPYADSFGDANGHGMGARSKRRTA